MPCPGIKNKYCSAKLNVAGHIGLTRDHTEVCSVDRRPWRTVEGFGPELKLEPFGHAQVLEQRKVRISRPLRANRRKGAGEITGTEVGWFFRLERTGLPTRCVAVVRGSSENERLARAYLYLAAWWLPETGATMVRVFSAF